MQSAPDENNPGHASAPNFEVKDHIPLIHIKKFRNIENMKDRFKTKTILRNKHKVNILSPF